MRYIDDPKASNAIPISGFYAYRISFVVIGDGRGVVDLHHNLVVLVHIRQLLGKSIRAAQPPNVTPFHIVSEIRKPRYIVGDRLRIRKWILTE